MKRSNVILISAMALASFAAVVAVQAQSTGTADNAPATTNYNVNVAVNANDNTNLNANAEMPSTTATGSKLTKIPSPDYIKYFREVRKIGDSLYGFLISGVNTMTGKNPQTPATGDAGSVTGTSGATNTPASNDAKLTKIPSPDYIKYFREIRKIGDSLYGILANGANAVMGNVKPRHIVTADESACVISAITAKDQTIMAAHTTEATGFNAAVAARTACQTTALSSTDGQGAALENCLKDFRTAASAARDTLNKTQKDAWTTYTTALKACVATPTTNANTTTSPEIMVEDGGNSL